MKILYTLFSALVIAIGCLHMATTFRLSWTAASKIWFFGAGMSLVLAGVLNLLNRQYGLRAFGVRATSVFTNLFMLGFAAVAGRITNASVPEQIVMLALLAVVLLLSLVPAASSNPGQLNPTETAK